MSLFKAYDAEYPPASAPTDCHAVLGYIGGSADHTWTVAEWNHASNNGRLRQGPIWGAQLDLEPTANGQAAAAAAKALGWGPGRCIWLDMENWQDETWVAAFIAAVKGSGYEEGTYGSQSTVTANPVGKGGYWIADWNGNAVVSGENVSGHQYLANVSDGNTVVNYDVFEVSVIGLFGIGPRT